MRSMCKPSFCMSFHCRPHSSDTRKPVPSRKRNALPFVLEGSRERKMACSSAVRNGISFFSALGSFAEEVGSFLIFPFSTACRSACRRTLIYRLMVRDSFRLLLPDERLHMVRPELLQLIFAKEGDQVLVDIALCGGCAGGLYADPVIVLKPEQQPFLHADLFRLYIFPGFDLVEDCIKVLLALCLSISIHGLLLFVYGIGISSTPAVAVSADRTVIVWSFAHSCPPFLV